MGEMVDVENTFIVSSWVPAVQVNNHLCCNCILLLLLLLSFFFFDFEYRSSRCLFWPLFPAIIIKCQERVEEQCFSIIYLYNL